MPKYIDRRDAADGVLDTRTAIALGQALFGFIARVGENSEDDEFTIEDTGLQVISGFIELPTEVIWQLGALLEKVDEACKD